MRIPLLLLITALPIIAQAPAPSPITPTTSAPSGSCSGNQGRLVGPGGTIYTCQNGTWGQISGGGTVATTAGIINLTYTPSTVTIGSNCTATNNCNVANGDTITSFSASSTLTSPSGSGEVYVYVTQAGVETVGYPSSGLSFTCTGCTAVSGITAFPADVFQVGTCTAASGSWTGCSIISPVMSKSKTITVSGALSLTETPTQWQLSASGGSIAPITVNNSAVTTPSAPTVTAVGGGSASWEYGIIKVNAYGWTPVSTLTTGTGGPDTPTSTNYWEVTLPTDASNNCLVYRNTNGDDPGSLGTGFLVNNAPSGSAGDNYGTPLIIACDGSTFHDWDSTNNEPYESFSGYYSNTPTPRPAQPVAVNTTIGAAISGQIVGNQIGPAAQACPNYTGTDDTCLAVGWGSYAGSSNNTAGAANFSMALGPLSFIQDGGTNNLTVGQLSIITGGCVPGGELNLGGCTNVGIGGYLGARWATNFGIDGTVLAAEGTNFGSDGYNNGIGSITLGAYVGNSSGGQQGVPDHSFTTGSNLSDSNVSLSGYISDWFGSTIDTQPNPLTIHAGDIVAGTSNESGGNLNLAAGRGTGNGTPGEVNIQVAPAGSSGSAQNALTTVATFTPSGESLPGAIVPQSGMLSAGTFPTITGCGTISNTQGGSTGGSFSTTTTGTCTAAFTMPTAPHGWTCVVQDITQHVAANILIQTASTTTSCTVTGTTAASDVLTFMAIGW